ncbi:DUF1456 domain-containing protein [Alteromonas sp. KS69]|jgi:uncharacterized protein YehS (DUF1456 family)|uniref:DUF1456 family protein n=1 Tax=Alteromonas naphthalenivorans TaxID=715451 RepID=F5ZAP9_ALTNA|nr:MULTISPECIES: DUF1456 family protein [Alteromonas]MBB68299.1 DUF1456 domain-containing protein [Rickettsiales bacterium]PHS57625.1 MAG: DUF1456 domain-containing protein [Alteromonas sp.]AEF02179.1 hypothetical protein ambt_03135 [Alteromonas naphthalenivorans]MBO7924285.1 DUF1456 family protein [Alteromonas sp. K632G]RUP83306.1 DUF1456 domain-containing protein [Alteromonas sp. KS69]|tara:strand:+ start:51208 stop:51807 length:600 start_codon:yes stop_codon:yes gene_type:complete
MIHNDVLRRLRFALAINDTAAIGIFKLVDYDMDVDYLHSIMKKEGEEGYLPCRDKIISLFLDGLIIKRRGKQEGVEPVILKAGERLSNNEVLRKIRIAMSYKDEDMINALQMADFRLSKNELSAFFRKPDHRNYKVAGDQVVRNLLQGMVKKYRPDAKKTAHTKEQVRENVKADMQAQKAKEKAKEKANKPSSVWGKTS